MIIIGIGTKTVAVNNIDTHWIPAKENKMRHHGDTFNCRCVSKPVSVGGKK